MNKTIRNLFLWLLAISMNCASCTDNPYNNEVPQLVVEGWIDSGDHPIVFVTTTVPFSTTKKTSTDFSSHILNWAKVTVSDGEHTVVMTGRVMANYPIGYGFSTSNMRGEAGKTYKLTVDYANYHAQATTTIPLPCTIDSFRCFTLPEKGDSLYELHAYASHLALTDNGACKFFAMRKGKDKQYLSCNMGLFPAQAINDYADFSIFQGHRMKKDKKDKYSPYFSIKDTVLVKFSTTEADGYRFWKSYEVNLSLASSPFFGTTHGLQGNVDGAIGYWLGYGSTEYIIWPDINKKTKATILRSRLKTDIENDKPIN